MERKSSRKNSIRWRFLFILLSYYVIFFILIHIFNDYIDHHVLMQPIIYKPIRGLLYQVAEPKRTEQSFADYSIMALQCYRLWHYSIIVLPIMALQHYSVSDYGIIITDPYQIPLFSLCIISTIAASTFYQEKIWYSSVIIIDNYFGQTALLNILQPASGFALSSFSFALSQLQYIQ